LRPNRTAAAISLLCAALAAAGCGFGPGEGVGEVTVTVTRDYGAEPVVPPLGEQATESDTVMRVLERGADISTRYGGGFVHSIEGLSAATRDGRSFDWFFYVNGVESPVGAAAFTLRGGEAIWWDYRDWTEASRVPAVVGSWPHPFLAGYEGRSHPVAVECEGGGAACATVRGRLADEGVTIAPDSPPDAIRVLVGPWARLRADPTAAQIEQGPRASGVFADLARRRGAYLLVGLDAGGEPVRKFGRDAGLVAAARRYEAPPVWVVTGGTARGVRVAASLLDADRLRDRYALASEGGRDVPLPIGSG
jgi:hypothetical protein